MPHPERVGRLLGQAREAAVRADLTRRGRVRRGQAELIQRFVGIRHGDGGCGGARLRRLGNHGSGGQGQIAAFAALDSNIAREHLPLEIDRMRLAVGPCANDFADRLDQLELVLRIELARAPIHHADFPAVRQVVQPVRPEDVDRLGGVVSSRRRRTQLHRNARSGIDLIAVHAGDAQRL